jgi:hypothetical protein
MAYFQFGYPLEGIAMEDVGLFYGKLVDLTGIWSIFLTIWW